MTVTETQADIGERLRSFLPSLEERKGLLLSHLLGFALFSEFALNIFKFQIPMTPPGSIPIRLIAIWLLIDRTGRMGRYRLGLWDAITLGFFVLTSAGMLYTATTAPGVPISFEDFRRFGGLYFSAYLYYVVAREGINRRGFRPDITVNWLVAGFAWSAMVGLMQSLNILGARTWSGIYANLNLASLRSFSPSTDDSAGFASGTAAWWNSMALEMLVAFALVFGPTFLRRPKWYEWALGMLFMTAFIATQSRGGLAAFGACAIATFVWYLYHKKYLLATIIGATVSVGVIIWVFAVFALKIEKFTVTLQGETVKGSVYSQSLTSRLIQQRQLVDIGLKQPIFGTGVNFGYTNVDIISPYTMNGASDTNYGYTFAQFGLVGLVYLIASQLYLMSFIRTSTAFRPYAFAAFFVGVAVTVHGLVEFLLFGRAIIVLNLLAAYAGSSMLATEQGRSVFKRFIKLPQPLASDTGAAER